MFKFTMYKFYIETTNKVSILITFPHIPQIEEYAKIKIQRELVTRRNCYHILTKKT